MVYLPIPPEVPYSDYELDQIGLEPPGLFPEDQNSVFGQLRHVLSEHMQGNLVDKLAQWYLNLDPRTVHHDDLAEWEEQLGIPPIPTGYTTTLSDAFRRGVILSRYPKGPFTRARRNAIIEQFISATFGQQTEITPDGLVLDAGGIPMYAGNPSLSTTYRVYEDVRNAAYQVWILSSITPDTATLLRELKFITPAPTSANVTIDNSQSEINDYALAMRNTQPNGHWRGNQNDASGYANTGTLNGTPATVASPGLLAASATAEGCIDFDGTDDYINVPNHATLQPSMEMSLAAWVNADTLSSVARIIYKGNYALSLFFSQPHMQVNAGSGGVQGTSFDSSIPTTTTKFLVMTFDGKQLRGYINGVLDKTYDVTDGPVATDTGALRIGANTSGTERFNGRIDEPAMWNRVLSQAEITELYNQGRGVLA